MPLSEAKKASNKRWDEKNLKRCTIGLPITLYNQISEARKKTGESLSLFIKKAVEERLKNEGKSTA